MDDLVPAAQREVDRPDLDRERRHVRDERPAGAVVDQATGRRDRLEDRAVRLCLGREVAPVDDLEVEDPRSQDAEREDDDQREGEEPDRASLALLVATAQVLRGAAHQSIRSSARRRSTIATRSGATIAARTVS